MTDDISLRDLYGIWKDDDMTDGKGLLPCPLCGGKPTAIETHMGRGELYCPDCDLVLGGNDAMTPEELTERWNRREPCTLQHGKVQGRTQSDAIGQDLSNGVYAPRTSVAEELRGYADRAMREGGLWFSGGFLDALARRAESETGECEMAPSFTEPGTLDDCQEFCCSECGEYMVIQQFAEEREAPNFCQHCGARNLKEAKK